VENGRMFDSFCTFPEQAVTRTTTGCYVEYPLMNNLEETNNQLYLLPQKRKRTSECLLGKKNMKVLSAL